MILGIEALNPHQRANTPDPSIENPALFRAGRGHTLIRTVMLRLLPDEEVEARLKALRSLASKLWSEVNYVRRRQFSS